MTILYNVAFELLEKATEEDDLFGMLIAAAVITNTTLSA